MTKSKPISFSGATLTLGGGVVDSKTGQYTRHSWRVLLADGTVYRNDMFRHSNNRQWRKEWPNPYFNHNTRWQTTQVIERNVGAFDNVAIEAWVRSQPNYKADK